MNKNKTYLDFGVAMDELRKKSGVSFDTMSFKIGIAQSYLWGLANRRRANMPKEELIKKIADYFDLPPSYFYEHRLKNLLNFIDNNREYLDHCLRQAKRLTKKISDKPEEVLEDFEKIEETEKETEAKKRGRI
ncbi:hypothetical protein ES705_11199 [subsurface metagenome]